jgi:uncharacterized protein
MSDAVASALDRLGRVPGVRAAVVVDARAGVPVMGDVAVDVAGQAVAALTAALYRRTAQGAAVAELGRVLALQLEAADGHLVLADAGELLVVAVTEPGAQLGMVRLEVRRTAEALG